MARVQKFWADFIRDSEALQKAQSFPMLLWQGITSSGDVRRQIWSKFKAPVPEGSGEEIPKSLRDEIISNVCAELENAQTSGVGPALKPGDADTIQRLILAHIERNDLTRYDQGTAQLIATLLAVIGDEATVVGVHQFLHERLEEYRADDWKKLHNDVLVVADVMMQELGPLCAHFNQCGFDVVDLRDVVGNWMQAIFASFFPSMAVIRFLDIFLFDGPESLIGLVFGVFKVFSNTLQEKDVEDLYRTITEIPRTMSDRNIEDALRYGYETVRLGAKRIAELRAEKDWSKCMCSPGPMRFAKNVGNPASVPFPRDDVSYMSTQTQESNEVKDTKSPNAVSPRLLSGKDNPHAPVPPLPDNTMQIVIQTDIDPNADVLSKLERQRSAADNPALKRLFDEAIAEINKQKGALSALQEEVKHGSHRSGRRHRASTDHEHHRASSAESSFSESAAEDAGPTSEDDGAGQRPDNHRSKRNEVDKGVVQYSKLYQFQQFPCLYMEGYLLKARKASTSAGFFKRNVSGLFGNVHRRFFVLQGAFLTYFKSHRTNTPSKDVSVDMRGRTITRIDKHKFGKFGFEISERGSDSCLYLLFATNADERNVWVQVLTAASEP